MIYVDTLQEALNRLDIAINQAIGELPWSVVKEHEIAVKKYPSAWNHVYHAHMHEYEQKPELVLALFTLKAATEARLAVFTAIDEAATIGREIILPKLSRMR